MNNWDVKALDLKPRLPEILSSTPDARAIALDLLEGESLADHEVHERTWAVVVTGQVEVTGAGGSRTSAGAGSLIEFAPGERHGLHAESNARLLLLLTPWPGAGHPGGMTIREKLYARRHAAKRKQQRARPE